MDQLKDILRQCLKHRFWIAFGISLLLPAAGYFAGAGTINEATTKKEGDIKKADSEIKKYASPGIVNHQYSPIASAKKEALVKDVDATWRKLFALQEPLLRWPEVVEARFRKWGRKYPSDIDRNSVQLTVIDYVIGYREFIDRLYKIIQPFNFDDGKGIVVAPPADILLRPAPFSQDAPPDLGKVWAEQERIWVLTALLDVIAKVNASVQAKSWEEAIVKQISLLEVGAMTDQDQRSMAKGEQLVPSDPLLPEGVTAPTTPPPGGGTPGAPGMLGGASGGGGAAQAGEVFYLKTDATAQYKVLPIKMTVLVDQARLPDFLVGLENSPMAIQVLEIEVTKPLTPVAKPVYGDKSYMGASGMGGRGDEMAGPGGMGGRIMGLPGGGGKMLEGRDSSAGGPRGGMTPGAPGRPAGQPADKKTKRKADNAESDKKDDAKSKIDQYYNIIEVTVYGQARFYLAPPPLPTPPASSTPDSNHPAPAVNPAPPAEAPKPDDLKAEAPKAEAPKPDAPAVDAPKPDAPKPDATKAEAPTPKS